MPDVIFSHPQVNDLHGALTISTGANEISWGYALNTKTFPTYGGEVIQILSAYTTDLVVTGTVASYTKLEAIYGWFVSYLQLATQDGGGKYDTFDQTPVSFAYPHRGWTMEIMPKSLPGFRYGREVVTPEWRIEAAVIEEDKALKDQIIGAALKRGVNLADFGRMTAEIGFIEDNPFSAPFTGDTDADSKTTEAFGELGTYYSDILDSYASGDFENLHADYSKPAFLGNQGTAQPGNSTGVGDKPVTETK